MIALGYDLQGNLSFKNNASYAFDYGNRLRTTATQSYRYDAQGRRVRQDVAGSQLQYSQYAADGRLMWQRDETTNQRIANAYLAGSLLAEISRPLTGNTTTIRYLHTDALRSPIAKTSATGAIIETSEYEPYGRLLNRANDNRAGYTGHVMDAVSGLTYMQQRYYDPSIGRFLSVDSVAAYTKKGILFNRYWYANGNPYRFTDPDGRYTCGGDKEFCAKIDSYISALRESARALREGGASKRDEFLLVRNALAEIGEKGKGGPHYVPGTVAGRGSAHTDQYGTTTVQVSKIANAQLGAQNIGHEATHDRDVRTGGLKTTEAQVRETETNAYSTSRAVDMGFGKYWTQSQFDEAVDDSVQLWRDNQPKQGDGE